MINHDLSSINWYEMFDGLDVNQAADSFTTFFLSVLARHVPNREITCCDRDAPWITDDVKKAIKRKHRVYRRYVKRGRKPEDWTRVKHVKNDATKMITDAKTKYYSGVGEKFCDRNVGIKTYWKALHKIINKKQVMNIPPILLNGVFITNFQNKANLFNEFFVQQYSIPQNGSVLPHIDYETNVRKFSVSVNEAKIISIIRKLSPNKAHGCDNISIRMLKICDTVIARPLKIIYEKCIEKDRLPLLWKKVNIVPAHKKNSRRTNFSLIRSRVFVLVTLLLTSYCQSLMIFIMFLNIITIHVLFLWIFRKRLTKCGMRGSCSSLNRMVSAATC